MPRLRLAMLIALGAGTFAFGQPSSRPRGFGQPQQYVPPSSGAYVPLPGGGVPQDVPSWFEGIRGSQARQQFDQEAMGKLKDLIKGRDPNQFKDLLENRDKYKALLEANKDKIEALRNDPRFRDLIEKTKGDFEQFKQDPKFQQMADDFKKLEEFRRFMDRQPGGNGSTPPAPMPNGSQPTPPTPPIAIDKDPPAGKGPNGDPPAPGQGAGDPAQIDNWLKGLAEEGKKRPFDPDAKNFDPEKWKDAFKGLDKVQPEEFPRPKADASAAPQPSPGDPQGGPTPGNPSDPASSQPSAAEPPKPPLDPRAEDFENWLNRTFGESKATKEMVDNFSKILDGKGLDGLKGSWLDGLNTDVGRFNDWAGTNWGGGNWNLQGGRSWLGNWNWNWGGNSAPRFNGPDISMPRFGGVSVGSPSGILGTIGVAIAIIGGLALLAWWLAKRNQGAGDVIESLPAEWLAAIRQARTREELVKLFEALSYTRVGKKTRTWHHKLIASEMARIDARAADELAGLYEVARYSPPAQQMAPADFDRANADAQRLNGGQQGVNW